MPIVAFSSEDLLRGKVVTPGWYLCKIKGVGEAPAANGQSTNYPAECTIIRNADDGSVEFAGVPLTWNFNSKAIGFAIGFLEALGNTVEAGQRFDLNDASEGKDLEIFIENDTYQGREVNRINHKYRPAKAA